MANKSIGKLATEGPGRRSGRLSRQAISLSLSLSLSLSPAKSENWLISEPGEQRLAKDFLRDHPCPSWPGPVHWKREQIERRAQKKFQVGLIDFLKK